MRVTTVLLALLGQLVLVGCTRAATVAEPAAPAAATALQSADVVDLTLYFRRGWGPEAHLVPVTRQVPVGEQLPRRALELLLAGPEPDDGEGLAPPLPTSTAVLDFQVVGEVAEVDLSAEVVADRAAVGASAEHELLALAALANTLTEFPEIEQVAVTVDGRSAGPPDGGGAGVDDVAEFWGWWGLPERLVRDDSVIGPVTDGGRLPELARFARAPQTIGAEGAQAVGEAVRVSSRTTSVRVTVELSDPGGAAAAPVPAATARPTADGVLLEVDGVAAIAPDVRLGAASAVPAPPFTAVTVDGDPPGPLHVLVRSRDPHPFLLHTLASPTRLVLDLRK